MNDKPDSILYSTITGDPSSSISGIEKWASSTAIQFSVTPSNPLVNDNNISIAFETSTSISTSTFVSNIIFNEKVVKNDFCSTIDQFQRQNSLNNSNKNILSTIDGLTITTNALDAPDNDKPVHQSSKSFEYLSFYDSLYNSLFNVSNSLIERLHKNMENIHTESFNCISIVNEIDFFDYKPNQCDGCHFVGEKFVILCTVLWLHIHFSALVNSYVLSQRWPP